MDNECDLILPEFWDPTNKHRQYGFFAECSNVLHVIADFFLKNGRLPDSINFSDIMPLYKGLKGEDVFSKFFTQDLTIKVERIIQSSFVNYNDHLKYFDQTNYELLEPFVSRYFKPSSQVMSHKNDLLKEYQINPSKTIGVYYRSTDKSVETGIPSHEVMYDKIKKIHAIYPSHRILIETDSQSFLDYLFSKKDINKYLFAFNKIARSNQKGQQLKGMHLTQSPMQNQKDMFHLFPVFLILSKCDYLICNSSNCSWWMMLFRGKPTNMSQYLDYRSRRERKAGVLLKKPWRDYGLEKHKLVLPALDTYNKYGFFSECTIILVEIIKFIKNSQRLPYLLDCSNSLVLYKESVDDDVFGEFFIQNRKIELDLNIKNVSDFVTVWDQLKLYNKIKFHLLNPIIRRYFRPSNRVVRRKNYFLRKYQINRSKTIGVYYRSTDKSVETGIPSHQIMYNKIKEIHTSCPSHKILIQTDSKNFLNYLRSKKDINKYLIIIKENIPQNRLRRKLKSELPLHLKRSPSNNMQDMFNLLPAFLILSKCDYLICNSSNCSWWMMLFRGSLKNVSQYLDSTNQKQYMNLPPPGKPGWTNFS